MCLVGLIFDGDKARQAIELSTADLENFLTLYEENQPGVDWNIQFVPRGKHNVSTLKTTQLCITKLFVPNVELIHAVVRM